MSCEALGSKLKATPRLPHRMHVVLYELCNMFRRHARQSLQQVGPGPRFGGMGICTTALLFAASFHEAGHIRQLSEYAPGLVSDNTGCSVDSTGLDSNCRHLSRRSGAARRCTSFLGRSTRSETKTSTMPGALVSENNLYRLPSKPRAYDAGGDGGRGLSHVALERLNYVPTLPNVLKGWCATIRL